MTATDTSTPAPFGALLKRWRAERRLSQLDLSLLTDVSQRHLSFLESGRSRPSRGMVMQLSEALEVPLRERNALLGAAGFANAFHERSLDETLMKPVREALERTLRHHEPFPAVVVDRAYDLVMENEAFAALTALFGDREAMWAACCPDLPRNLVRLMFHPLGARPFIRNFGEIAPLVMQRVHREASAVRSEAALALVEALRADAEIPAQWHEPDPLAPLPPVLPLAIGDGTVELRLFSMIATFGTPCDVTTDELRVETFFPADDASEVLLRGFAAGR